MKVILCKTASWRTPPSWHIYVKVYMHHDTTKMTYMFWTILASRHYNHVILTSGYTGIMKCHHQDIPTLSYTRIMTYHHHDIVALGHTVIIPYHYHDIPMLSHTGITTHWQHIGMMTTYQIRSNFPQQHPFCATQNSIFTQLLGIQQFAIMVEEVKQMHSHSPILQLSMIYHQLQSNTMQLRIKWALICCRITWHTKSHAEIPQSQFIAPLESKFFYNGFNTNNITQENNRSFISKTVPGFLLDKSWINISKTLSWSLQAQIENISWF